MKIDRVRFLSYVEPPGGGATVSELDTARDGVSFHLEGDFVFAEKSGKRCLYPVTNCARIQVAPEAKPASPVAKRRGRPRKAP